MSRLIISFFTYPEYGRIVIRTNTLKSGSVLYGSYPEISRKSSVSVPVENTLKYRSVYQNTADLHLTYWLVRPFKLTCILPPVLGHKTPETLTERGYEGRFFRRRMKKGVLTVKRGELSDKMHIVMILLSTGRSVETVRLCCTSARWHSPPFRSAHRLFLVFSKYIVERQYAPLLLAGSLQGLLLRYTPHTMLRIMFVAVDRTHA
jgi:hypothetical protein